MIERFTRMALKDWLSDSGMSVRRRLCPRRHWLAPFIACIDGMVDGESLKMKRLVFPMKTRMSHVLLLSAAIVMPLAPAAAQVHLPAVQQAPLGKPPVAQPPAAQPATPAPAVQAPAEPAPPPEPMA